MTQQPSPSVRRVLFVRHAESSWNRAKRRRDPILASRSVDAPLTNVGYQQARLLQEALRSTIAARSDGGDEAQSAGQSAEAQSASDAVLHQMGSAGQIWASPLTRSLQTALVGLLPLYESSSARQGEVSEAEASEEGAMAPVTLILKPVVREKKSLAWDSAGAARGDDCRMRACRKLARLPASTKPSDGELAAMREVACDASETERRWWTRTFESRAAARRRGHDLLHALSASPHATVVVVSHSIFLRELFSNFLTAAASDETRAAAKGALADGDRDGLLGVHHRLPAHQALGRVHRNRAHGRLAQVLRDLEHQTHLVALDLEGVEDGGQVVGELHVDDGADDLGHLARLGRHGRGGGIAGA